MLYLFLSIWSRTNLALLECNLQIRLIARAGYFGYLVNRIAQSQHCSANKKQKAHKYEFSTVQTVLTARIPFIVWYF